MTQEEVYAENKRLEVRYDASEAHFEAMLAIAKFFLHYPGGRK